MTKRLPVPLPPPLLVTILLATLVTTACTGSAAETSAPETDATPAGLTADDRAEILARISDLVGVTYR